MKTDSVIGEDDGKVLPKENMNAQVKEKLKRGENKQKKYKREDRLKDKIKKGREDEEKKQRER